MKRHSLIVSGLVVLYVAGTFLRAGFDQPENVPDDRKLYDGAPLGKGTEPIDPETKAKLERDCTSVQRGTVTAQEKVEFIRKTFVKAIALAKEQDPEVGAALEEAYRGGRVCIDFGAPAAIGGVVQHPRPKAGEPREGAKAINISFREVSLFFKDRPCWDRFFVTFFTLLLHEGRHLTQEAHHTRLDGETPREFEWRTLKEHGCREVEACDEELKFLNDLLRGLGDLAAGLPPPGDVGGGVKKILDDMVGSEMNAEELAKAAEDLAEKVKDDLIPSAETYRRCNQTKKEVYDEFYRRSVAGESQLDLEREIDGRFDENHWIRKKVTGLDDRRVLFIRGETPSRILQTGEGGVRELETGLRKANAVHFLGAGERMVAVGPFNELGDGALVGFQDLDEDGFFEEETRRVLVESQDLFDGGCLAADVATGGLIFFNALTNGLWRITDGDDDGFPERIETAGEMDLSRTGILSIAVSADGRVVYGLPFEDLDASHSLDGSLEIAVSTAAEPGGEFIPAASIPFLATAAYAPLFLEAPRAGPLLLKVDAPPGSAIEVHRVDAEGASLGAIAEGMTAASGVAILESALVLVPGDRLRAIDAARGLASVIEAVALPFRRGDSNADGGFDISDPVATLAYLFLGEGSIPCQDAADANDDAALDISDAIASLAYLFTGGRAPPAPGPASCGPDPTADELPCAAYAPCGG